MSFLWDASKPEGGGILPEMYIDSIRLSPMNYQRVVILKEKDSDRYLPIWIGQFEADAIAVKLQEVKVPRPLTHDLLGNVIDAMGGVVKRVVVSDLQNDTFYAKIILEFGENSNGHSKEVDSRPSDALALAVRTGVPIFVEEGVLSKAGVQLDEEAKRPRKAARTHPARHLARRNCAACPLSRTSWKDWTLGTSTRAPTDSVSHAQKKGEAPCGASPFLRRPLPAPSFRSRIRAQHTFHRRQFSPGSASRTGLRGVGTRGRGG